MISSLRLRIPIILIYSRLILGLIIISLSYYKVDNYKAYAITLLAIGLLTDIFDGIIARHLNISTQKLRRLDSSVDQVFFICVITATFIQCPGFFKTHAIMISILLGFEVLTYVVSFLKFRKEIATHTLGAKFWTLSLFATLIQIIMMCQSSTLFYICFWLGLVTRTEIIAIILVLRNWTNDVPSIYHAFRLRQNKEIKKHKMLNG